MAAAGQPVTLWARRPVLSGLPCLNHRAKAPTSCEVRLGRSHAQDVRLGDGPGISGCERHEGLGVARRPDELDLQRAVRVHLNDGSDVARSQAVPWNVVKKDDRIEQAELHDDLYTGENRPPVTADVVYGLQRHFATSHLEA